MSITPRLRAVFLAAALVGWSAAVMGQTPDRVSSSPATKKTPGTEDLLLGLLDRYATLVAQKRNKGAENVAALFGRFEWKKVPVPRLVHRFVMDRLEAEALPRATTSFGPLSLPPCLGGLAKEREWASLTETEAKKILRARNQVTSKKIPQARRPHGEIWRVRSLQIILERVFEDLGPRLEKANKAALKALRSGLHRLYSGFRLRCAMKTSSYRFLPQGRFLRLAARIGDERAFESARSVVLESELRPGRHLSQLGIAALALVELRTSTLEPSVEKERRRLIAKLRSNAALPAEIQKRLR